MRNERLAWLAVAALGALVVWYATANGVGVSTDSMTYLRGAENLARGNGYSVVSEDGGFRSVTHWPPLYSIAISLPVRAGFSATTSARIVNAGALASLLFLAALLARRLSSGGAAIPVAATLCLLASPAVARNYVMAWSESIFLPLALLGFVKMLDYCRDDRARDLLIAASCFGLAVVDRYSGAAFVAAIAAWLLFPRPRWGRALAFACVASLPAAWWFLRNVFATSRAHDRPFGLQMLSIDHVRAAADSLSLWLLPEWIPLRARLLWLAGAGLLAVLAFRAKGRDATREIARHERFWSLAAWCVAAYLAFVSVTIMLFDHDVNYDTRMMSPILVLLVVFLAAASRDVLARPRGTAVRLLAVVMVASVTAVAIHTGASVRASHREPAQYAARRWTQSRAWRIVRAAPASVPVFSSSPYIGRYFLERAVRPLPVAWDEHRAPGGDVAYLLLHPGLNRSDAALARYAVEELRARAVDSTDVVVLYEIPR